MLQITIWQHALPNCHLLNQYTGCRNDYNYPIAQPPWSGLGKRLESACRKALYDFQMLENVDKIAVALSGGKDSLSLLFMLKAIIGRGFPKAEITAIHVNGEFTCGAGVNLSYLQGICDALEVPLLVRESTQKLETLKCYNCSRERRSLLFRCCKERGSTHRRLWTSPRRQRSNTVDEPAAKRRIRRKSS